MAQYYIGQSNLRIELETGITLTGNTVVIKYKKPDGVTGQWAGTISTDVSKVYYDLTSTTDIDVAGKWYFWAHVTYGDASIGKGNTATQYFYKEGDV